MSERVETVVLDSEGLSSWIGQDRAFLAMLKVFHEMGADLAIGANTIVEVCHSRTHIPRLNWALSRIKVEPVTEQAAKAAAGLLEEAGLHGHKYAVDATVAEVALRQPKPVALLTSDSDDMTKLCGSQVRVIPL
ncbi:DNA-binding protein [Streptomyces sp. NPDC087420]|uniref:DNA-binding protein n=1 Tax=Streptomyces sp. NPDC087420 TaxID=3365785 RepID=UPI0038325D92